MNPNPYLILPLISGICWGTAGVFVRVLADAGLDNVTIICSRAIVALPVIFILILISDHGGPFRRRQAADCSKLRVRPADLPVLFGIGIFGILLLSFMNNIAVLRTSLSLASVLLCLAPVYVLIISAILFRERITRRKVICMILALAGCVLLSGLVEDLLGGGGNMHWDTLGFFMGLGSGIASAGYTLLSRVAADRGYGSMTIYFYSFLIAVIVLIPLADWSALAGFFLQAPVRSGGILLLQSVWGSMLPSMLYIQAVLHAKADTGRISILASGAEPTSAMLFGLILFGEIPSLLGFGGMVMTVAALIVLLRENK